MAKVIDAFSKIRDDNEFEKLIKIYNEKQDIKSFKEAYFYYYKKRVEYELIIQQEEDLEWKDNWGMGFWFVLNEYKAKPIISDFMATCMLYEIYSEEDKFKLEDYLHSKFNSKDTILKVGIKQYIVNSVMGYDECLSGYLEVHTELLKRLEEKIRLITDDWDNYLNRKLDLEEIENITEEFISYTDDCNYSTMDLLLYLKFELGIDCLEKYNLFDDDEKDYYDMLFDNLNISNQKVLSEYKNMINKYIKCNEIPDTYIETEKRKKEKLKLKKTHNKVVN